MDRDIHRYRHDAMVDGGWGGYRGHIVLLGVRQLRLLGMDQVRLLVLVRRDRRRHLELLVEQQMMIVKQNEGGDVVRKLCLWRAAGRLLLRWRRMPWW